MTNQAVEAAVEVADVLQDMMARTEAAAAYRDPTIPEGTLLYEQTDAAGATVRYRKPSSMVRAGNTALPERFQAWDKFGVPSMLPTAQMGHFLSKPRADSPGERAFHTHTRGTTRENCEICPPAQEPIEFKCQWCMGARAIRNTFFSETDAIMHQRRMHQDEYTAMEAALDRAERREQMDLARRNAEAQIALAEAMKLQAESQALTRTRRATPESGA